GVGQDPGDPTANWMLLRQSCPQDHAGFFIAEALGPLLWTFVFGADTARNVFAGEQPIVLVETPVDERADDRQALLIDRLGRQLSRAQHGISPGNDVLHGDARD